VTTLEIRLFGTLALERDGQIVSHFPSRRVKELLAYLLLRRGEQQSREQLAGLFWSDGDGDHARRCLNTSLWRLQRVLGAPPHSGHPYLRVDAQYIGFNTASDFRLDVAEFEQHCLWADRVASPPQQAELYRQAVTYYRADLLTECYEDWCLIERERLHCLYLRALGRLFAYYSASGEHDAAVDCARRILAGDPLREEVHRDLIKLYLAARQPGAAMRQYRACEGIIKRELGTEPMPETQALLSRIMADAVAPRAFVSPNHIDQDLATALACLQDAARTFDRARSQLGEAAGLVAKAVRQRGATVLDDGGKPSGWAPRGMDQLLEAERLVAAAAQQLDRLPAR